MLGAKVQQLVAAKCITLQPFKFYVYEENYVHFPIGSKLNFRCKAQSCNGISVYIRSQRKYVLFTNAAKNQIRLNKNMSFVKKN